MLDKQLHYYKVIRNLFLIQFHMKLSAIFNRVREVAFIAHYCN